MEERERRREWEEFFLQRAETEREEGENKKFRAHRKACRLDLKWEGKIGNGSETREIFSSMCEYAVTSHGGKGGENNLGWDE